MFKMRETAGVVLAITIAAFTAFAQAPPTESPHRSITKTEAVEYLYPEQVTVTAAKTSPVTLHFRIRQDLHINSHTPKDSYLIPTVFSIPEDSGVRLEGATYPAGLGIHDSHLPEHQLSVYTGEFAIRARSCYAPGIILSKPSFATRPATRVSVCRRRRSRCRLM